MSKSTTYQIINKTLIPGAYLQDALEWIRVNIGGTGGIPIGGTTGQVLAKIDATDYNVHWITPSGGGGGSGDVVGPAGATDNHLVVFDGATGKLIKGGGTTVAALTALINARIAATEKGAANGVATLGADSKIPESQLPALAITDVFPVASQAAMLALTAERGDLAIRSDINKSFALSALPASTLANWLELKTPADVVLSVAGKTGAVTLDIADITGLTAALAGKEPTIAPAGGTPTAQYWRGDKAWADFATSVRTALLTGFVSGPNSAVAATDTVLQAMQKLQAQITAGGGGGGGGLTFAEVTGTSQAVAVNTDYHMTNAAVTTLTAPASASPGDTFGWAVCNGRADNVINWNGLKHENISDSTLVLTGRHAAGQCTYVNATYGWKIK